MTTGSKQKAEGYECRYRHHPFMLPPRQHGVGMEALPLQQLPWLGQLPLHQSSTCAWGTDC